MLSLAPTRSGQRLLAATRVAFYLRVSPHEDGEERDTITNQRQYLERKYAADFDADSPVPIIPVAWLEDNLVSGAVPLGDRPEGARLLELARLHEIDQVIVYRLDRLGRSVLDQLQAADVLQQYGVDIKSATEPFDMSTPSGRFMFQMLSSVAELERSTIKERMNLGRDRAARDGLMLSGPVPYGFDVNAERKLIPSERWVEALQCSEAEVARLIIERIADGGSSRTVALWLTSIGVPAPKRYRDKLGNERQTLNHCWGPERVAGMVRDSMYRGLRVLHHTSGDIEQNVPVLVDDATWHRANAQIDRNKAMSLGPAKYIYLLRGRIFCPECGGGMQGNYQIKHGRSYYGCGKAPGKSHNFRGTCKSHHFRGEPIEELILSEIDAFVLDPGPALDELREQVRERQGTAAKQDGRIRHLHERLRETEDARRDVMALVKRRRVTIDEADIHLEEIAVEAAEIRRDLQHVQSQADLADLVETQLTDTAHLLRAIREDWFTWRANNDRAAMQPVVEQLVIEVRPVWKGEPRRVYAFRRPSSSAGYAHDHAAQVDEICRLVRGGNI